MTNVAIGKILARLDERTLNMAREFDDRDDSIKSMVKEIKEHQIYQNGKIAQACLDVARNKDRITVIWKIGLPIIAALISWLAYLSICIFAG